MNFLNTLKRAREVHWTEGRYWLSFTLLGGLIPLWGGALLLWLLSSGLEPWTFVDQGQFAIFSAAVLAPALYIVVREYKVAFPERAFWGFGTIALLIFSLLFFAGATAPDAAPAASFNINRTALRVLTPLLYAVSVSIAFALTVIREALVSEPSLDDIHTAGRLEDTFDELPK